MQFNYEILTPVNTPITTPTIYPAPLTFGILTKVLLFFPFGSLGNLYVQLFRGGIQRFPFNPEGNYRGNNNTYSWDGEIPIHFDPFSLESRSWNTDTLYPHTYFLTLNIRTEPMKIIRTFKELEEAV